MGSIVRVFGLDRLRFCKRFATRAAMLVTAWLTLTAHVGTNQVVFEGMAGEYPVRVIIRPPGVVPAQVPIVVRVLRGMPTRVTVRAAQWNVGLKGAPPAEAAAIVPGDSNTYAHDLWIMTSSAYAVYVGVEGPSGAGTLLVPVQSFATHTLSMPNVIGGVLIVLGALLIIGIFTLVGAAAREGTLAIGQSPDSVRKRTARIATGASAAVIAVALLGGAAWWRSADQMYQRRLEKPLHINTSVRGIEGVRRLVLRVDDALWTAHRTFPIIADHGKLMHLFLVSSDAGAIAHLHPLRTAYDKFESEVPAVPGGKYFLFADVVDTSGYQRTLVDTVDVPVAPAIVSDEEQKPASATSKTAPVSLSANSKFKDIDDAWRAVASVAVGEQAQIDDGNISLTLSADAVVNRDLSVRVAVTNANGEPVSLEPYMGMGGHMMVMREDGGVFVHLHPMGSASMAAQAVLLQRERTRASRGQTDSATLNSITSESMKAMGSMDGTASAGAAAAEKPGTLSFPFAFPTDGRYRVFVQVKRNGAVQTAAFTVIVKK